MSSIVHYLAKRPCIISNMQFTFAYSFQLRKFVTDYNKAIIGSLLAAGSVTELFGFFAPETMFLQDYKNLLTFKEMEEPYPLGPKVEQAKKEVNYLS